MTFNRNEAEAVDLLLDELTVNSSGWSRKGSDAVVSTQEVLRHVRLDAQGNVLAATSLASAYMRKQPPDFYVFFGCAGAIDPNHSSSIFLVDAAKYISLGTVSPHDSVGEIVTLKNKWLAQHEPPDVHPLDPVEFPLARMASAAVATGESSASLSDATGLPVAHVAATDKVVRVGPGTPPVPLSSAFGHKKYKKAEWSYRDSLAFVNELTGTRPLLVEMESFGIGSVARELHIDNHVVVIRVTTDSLVDHGDSDESQQRLLKEARHGLALVILALLEPNHPHLIARRQGED